MDLSNSFDKPKISNLTKNLQQHQHQHQASSSEHHGPQDPQLAPPPNHQDPSFSNFNSFPNHFNGPNDQPQVNQFNQSSQYQNQTQNPLNIQSLPNHPPTYSQSINKFNSFSNSHTNSLNYLPSTHNTPNVIGSSYSSNNSYKFNQFNPSHSIPTTNVNLDNNLIPNFQRNSYQPQSFQPQSFQPPIPLQQPGGPSSSQSIPQSNLGQSYTNQSNPSQSTPQSNPPPNSNQTQSQMPNSDNVEPDHYMTYHEFFNTLSTKSTTEDDDDHLNIIDYPVNDLILMLSCLLTKIIEANDKLHPNHFDNTIALRQRLKSTKRRRKLDKHEENNDNETTNDHDLDDEDEEEEDDEDEMKNKYLANVLAFHGTNVPGISLHAYLSRVLKYCPVTNEVFLSLLVYFDRIAKKANNLKKEKDQDQEQLFVMDSYNIHRLIISGITISSKFFSDIFYKNLRYAKVGGLPLEELNYLELQFLLLLDFKLMISVEDLQNYGDLLLRFWKREQITNQLIDQIQPSMSQGQPSSVQNIQNQ